MDADKKIQVGIALVDNKTIQVFNKQYLSKDTETDVISFEINKELPEGYYFLGDVIVSIDKVKQQAKEYQVTEAEELARVITHGVLHLLGYDDKTQTEQKKMKAKEDAVVKKVVSR